MIATSYQYVTQCDIKQTTVYYCKFFLGNFTNSLTFTAEMLGRNEDFTGGRENKQ